MFSSIAFNISLLNKLEIVTSSIKNSVDLNQRKYESNDTLKSKAYLHRLLGK